LLPAIRIESLDIQWDMAKSPKDPKAISSAKAAIKKSFERLTKAGANREFDVLILDEIVYCISKGLAKLEDVKKLIEKRDRHVEIILTGRGAIPKLIALADLVTEMKNIKHPFDKGTAARQGIEF
jgi:cob(I)alamin adenosyltransferase